MKIETHLHVKGGSGCAHVDPKQIIEQYKNKGYDAIVVTNHYNPTCFFNYPGRDKREKLDFFFSLYEKTYEEGKKRGIRVFYGTEITSDTESGVYQEMMLYGFDRKLLYDNQPMFCYNQKQLFEIAEKNGCFLYQTHPFRDKIELGDYRYMHGAEIYNGHWHHDSRNDMAEAFAKEHSLTGISGSDYHDFDQPINGGIVTDCDIQNERQLVECIFAKKFSLIIDGKVKE